MFSLLLSTVLLAVVGAHAETHTVHFTNNCRFGTPMLIQGPNVLSTGKDFKSSGPLLGAIAYLQTGGCGFNGEGCTLVETTLKNPTTPGSGSFSDISLIPPHSFSVTSGFGYYGGCDGVGTDCTNPNCLAFHQPNNTNALIPCQANDVNLAITFCD